MNPVQEKFTKLLNEMIENLKLLRDIAINLDILDTQEWINYQDKLNELSIDPDRN